MIAHVDNRITYNGNGNATEFAYQFKILDRTDIKVLLTDADGKEKLLTKDYYVDVEKNVVRYPGYAVGAEVPESERPPVLPTGWKLTIYREVPVTQETDLPDQYPFNQVEDIGDKLTMIAQQLTDVTGRSLKIGVSTSADIDTTIPWENGKSFRISDDGKTLELSEDPAKVLPLAQGVYAQTQAQAQSAAASATAAAKSEDSAAASASEAGNSAQSASVSAASAAESARLAEGYKNVAETAKSDAALYANNAKTSADNAGASKEAAQSAATTASNFASDARNSASEAKTYMDNAKNYSENVNVFVPSVSAEGVLSWSNKAGLANPPSVNIKGKDGADGGVTVDDTLSSTSTNPLQNKAIKAALDDKAGLDESNIFSKENLFQKGMSLLAYKGADGAIKWYQTPIEPPIASIDDTNYTGNAASATKATQDSAGNVITETYAKNNTANSWKEPQVFKRAVCKEVDIVKEVYKVSHTDGAAITLATNVVHHVASGKVTLDMTQAITDFLSTNIYSTVFSIYITSDGDTDYPLIITNAGTLKYVGSASDFAIKSAGLLLNILVMKDASGNVTSIVQASNLS